MANNDLVGSLTKGMDILRLIGSTDHGLKAGEIATSLNLKTSTCYNLVRTLCSGGFLEKRSGNYCIGPAISQLAENSHHNSFVAAVEHAKAENGQMLQTHRVSFERPGVIQRLNDEPMHPYASAAGLLALAYTDDESTRLIIASRWPFAEFGAHLWKDRQTLTKFLKNARKNGFAESPFDKEDFLRISGAVLNRNGKLAGTIGISVPMLKIKDDTAVKRLQTVVTEAAIKLSEKLD